MAGRELEASGQTFCYTIALNSAPTMFPPGCPYQDSTSLPLPLCFCFSFFCSFFPSPHQSGFWTIMVVGPKMAASAPGLPELPSPAAKANLRTTASHVSVSRIEDLIGAACIKCPPLVQLVMGAWGTHQCVGGGREKGILAQ